MAESIVTIDIATQLKSGLATALGSVRQTDPQGNVSIVTLRVDGVRDDTTKWNDPLVLPAVAARVREAYNHDFAQSSKLRHYLVDLVAVTWLPDDPWQIALYTISQAVGDYLLGPPTLTLSSGTFRMLHVGEPPVFIGADEEDRRQTMSWTVEVGVMRSA